MKTNLNCFTASGNLVRDPELKTVKDDKKVLNFDIAVNGMNDQVSYIRCTVWNKFAEVSSQHLKKGLPVLVSGRLVTETWEGENGKKHGFHIEVEHLEWNGSKKEKPEENKKA